MPKDTRPGASPTSALGRAQVAGDAKLQRRAARNQRRFEIDLRLMERWARNGFVSVPGGHPTVNADNEEAEE